MYSGTPWYRRRMQQTGVAATSYVGWCNRSRELSYVQVYMPYMMLAHAICQNILYYICTQEAWEYYGGTSLAVHVISL